MVMTELLTNPRGWRLAQAAFTFGGIFRPKTPGSYQPRANDIAIFKILISFIDSSHCPNMAPNSEVYHPQDALKAGINGALITGAAGAFASAIQNSLHKKNIGAMGVFTRTGSTAFVFSKPVKSSSTAAIMLTFYSCDGRNI